MTTPSDDKKTSRADDKKTSPSDDKKTSPSDDKKTSPAKDAAPAAPRAPLAELGIGAAWLVGLTAACQMAAVAFHSNPLAIVVVQAVIVDLAVGRAGVKWDPAANDKTSDETRNALRGVGIGVGAALAALVVVLAVSALLGWATFAVHAPTTSLALGAIRGVAISVRDAQLWAGLPVYFVGRARGVPRISAVVFGALAGAAAIVLAPAATPANVALAGAVSLATAALWYRDGAGWSAAGLCGGYAFLAGSLFRGGLVDVGWKKGSLAPGVVADGAPAWLAAALFIAVAAAVLRLRRPPPPASK